jgi:DNA-binding MarR family transcriptional regulator
MTLVATPVDVSALADRLRPLAMRLSRRLRREADQAGLSSVDVTLLSMVAKHPGIGVSEMADKERIARPTMSHHIKRLEAAGLVDRQEPQEDDRRRVGLVITAQGWSSLETVRRQRNDWLEARLCELAPADLAVLEQALEPLGRIVGSQP